MNQQINVTDRDTEKCKSVVQAFDELYNRTNIVVLDTGKYGFALLKYDDYDEFYSVKTYTNSNDLFDALWQEWLKEELIEFRQIRKTTNARLWLRYSEKSWKQIISC